MEPHLQTTTTAEREGTARAGSPRLATAACALAGIAFLVDTVTITLLDGPFDPLDSMLFFVGLVAGVVGVFTAAAFVTHGHRPKWLPRRLPRWTSTAALGVAFVVAGGTVVDLLGSAARAAYTGDNYGLQHEWDFFIFGLLLLAGAFALRRAGRGEVRSP